MLKRTKLAVFGAVIMLGCAHPRAADRQHPRLEVPFFSDSADECGPAVLASVLMYWGRPAATADLRRELRLAKLKGTVSPDLLLAARAHGLEAQMPKGTLALLKAEIDAGRPVITFVNLGFSFLPVGHFLVVTGYDDERGGVIAHSGKRRDEFLDYAKFQRVWERTGRWTLVASRP